MSYYIPSFICMICISVQIGRSSVRACIWTGPIGPGDTDGPDRTNSIGLIRLGLKSVGPGRYRSGPDRGCPYLLPNISILQSISQLALHPLSVTIFPTSIPTFEWCSHNECKVVESG